jgi:hypothetical protein
MLTGAESREHPADATPFRVIEVRPRSPMRTGMSIPAGVQGLALLSNRTLCELLELAESEERSLSQTRQQLHEQIEALKTRSADAPEEHAAELAGLAQRESTMSEERLELHLHIAELRLEKHSRLDSLRAPLRAVASRAED